jgi:short-subunit dehydrogenase
MNADFRDKYGPWALVAGASEGIGAAFASELAARGLHLLLVARRAGPLEDLADRLRKAHGVEVRVAAIDLGAPSLLDDIRAATAGLEIGLVVYNAAYSLIGRFLEQPLADKLRIIDVNVRGPLVLADEFGRAMAQRGRGGIIVMASIASSQGSPLVTTYAATKAFDLVFAEGLWDELRDNGVDVLACRAGATRTPAYERSKPAVETAPVMESEAVAREALAALGKTPSMVPGLFNGMATFFMNRVLPRKAAVMIMGRTARKMYG